MTIRVTDCAPAPRTPASSAATIAAAAPRRRDPRGRRPVAGERLGADRPARGARARRAARPGVEADDDHPALGVRRRPRPTRSCSAGPGTARRARRPRAGRRPSRSGRRRRGAGGRASSGSPAARSTRTSGPALTRAASRAAAVPGWSARTTGRAALPTAPQELGPGRDRRGLAVLGAVDRREEIAARLQSQAGSLAGEAGADLVKDRRVADLGGHPRREVLHQVADQEDAAVDALRRRGCRPPSAWARRPTSRGGRRRPG